jgi:hypothetical protein
MIALNSNSNVDNSDLTNYPSGRIKDNDGSGNGTPVNRSVYGDLHSTISKLMRLYSITPNGLPDNETNGFQIIDALSALASKNDFIYPITTNGTVLNVGIKLSSMKDNEFIVCLANFNKGSETQITGIGAGSFAITYSGSFKTNEYVRVIKTPSGVAIIRLADALSLDSMVADLLFLKKASQSEENTGTIDTKATTPLTNLTAFIRRVIGADSGSYLATAIRNGLYPKEHFSIVSGLFVPKNIGWFSGLDVGGSAGSLATSGNITSAVASTVTSDGSIVLVTMQNNMTNTNYFVRISAQSESSNILDSAEIGTIVFKPVSVSQFQIGIIQFTPRVQSLKLHLEVIQL